MFLHIPSCHRSRREYGIVISFHFFIQISDMENGFEAEIQTIFLSLPNVHFPVEASFRALTLSSALWLVGLMLWSVGPQYHAFYRTKYAFTDKKKLLFRLPQCRDGHFVDIHVQNQRNPHSHGGLF